jgi:uncharacterized protein (DUF58 family)
VRRYGGPVVLIGVLGLIITGAGLKRWELVMASLPGFILFGLICLSYGAAKPKLMVRRSVDPPVTNPGKTAIVTVEVTNRRDSSLGLVEMFDTLPSTVELVKGKNHRMFMLGPYETKRVKYKVRFHIQGEVKLGPMKWRSMDRMSFFFDEGVEETSTVVTVQRGVEDPRKLQVLPMRSNRPFGAIPARVKGIGTEFYGLREYVPMDSLRMVNWKATARRGRLISKEFEDERLGDVVLFVDMRPASRIGEGSLNTVDASVNGALAVAQKVLMERNRLSIGYARRRIGWISGITSRRHIQEVIERADFPEELETHPIHWLPWLVRRSFWTKAYLVVFTPLLDDDMTNMLLEIALMGYDILVVSPSPASTSIDIYSKRTADAALRLSRNLVLLRRRNRILKLAKSMRVLDWDFGEPLALTLKRVVRQRGGARWRIRKRVVGH